MKISGYLKHKLTHNLNRLISSIKWIVFSIIVGLVVGGIATLFYYGMHLVTLTRTTYPWLIYLLPLGGLFIVFCYHISNYKNDEGTNLVLAAIHSNEPLPFKVAPLVFIGTLVTHLFGGSAGREGAATLWAVFSALTTKISIS